MSVLPRVDVALRPRWASEAAHVLDGLLHHESSLVIRGALYRYGGATEHVFGLCHLFGFRFAPRFRDLSDRRRYVVDRRADHDALDGLIGGAINLRKIEENWDETLRITASIRAGTVAPSVLMRRLAAYPRQNALARALREIGCLERTLFILDWISDPALRRRSNAGLNKGEARNALVLRPVFPSSRRDPGSHLRKPALRCLRPQPLGQT